MRVSSFAVSVLAFLLLVFTTPSLADDGAGLPKLRRERLVVEKRSLFDPLSSLFGKRDDCGTQFGPTYVDCGPRGCYQPSLGQVCCGSESDYCDAGNYCVGLSCCPNGLLASCCGTGFNCPANVSDYYTTASTSPPPKSTSLPVSLSKSSPSTTSAQKSTSMMAPSTSSSNPAAPKSTSSTVLGSTTSQTSIGVQTSTNAVGVSSTVAPASGAQDRKLSVGREGIAVALLGVVGFVLGLV